MSDYIKASAYSDGKQVYSVAFRELHLNRPGLKITELILAPGEMVPWHTHDVVSDTFYVLKGEITVSTKDPDASVTVERQKTFTVKHGCPHQVVNAGTEDAHFITIGDAQGRGYYNYIPAN